MTRINRWIISMCFACVITSQGMAGENWPEFRGPTADGQSDSTGLPLTWSETEHVKWKTPIPHKGWSTPVVWGDQIWLTSASEDGTQRFVFCVDKNSGRIVHQQKLFETQTPEPLGNTLNSYASPSAVIEAGRVYVHFGSYGTACIDTKTFATLWERRDFSCRHYRGPASSPLLFENLLILTFDGIDVQYLAAVDKMTGKTVWKTNRSTDFDDLNAEGKPDAGGDWRKCFGTPIVIDVAGKKQLVSLGAKAAFGYDPRSGEEIWTVRHKAHSGSSRAVFGNGLIYLNTGNGKTESLAIRPDGKGDVTDTHVVWRQIKGVPNMPSSVLVGDQLYAVSDSGVATSFDAKTGEVIWQHRVGGQHCASVLHAEGKLYMFNRDGQATVMATGREPNVLATNKLDDGFMSSPAVSGKSLILRTRSHLYRIEN